MNKCDGFFLMKKKWPLLLSDEETLNLFKEYQMGSVEARNKIFHHNMRYVINIINSNFYIPYSGNPGYNYDDIIQVGMIGLLRAINDFDLSFNNKLTTFAKPYILNEIRMFLRKQKKHDDIYSLQECDVKFGNPNNNKEISREDHISDLYNFTDDMIKNITLQEIIQSFSVLNSQEKQVLSLCIGFSGSPLSYREAGKVLGISHARVGVVFQKAIKKLRKANHIDTPTYQRKKSQNS